MDSYLLSKTLRQHGAPLLRWLEAEQREALPQAIIQRAVLQEFGAAQMLELGDGNFQVRLNQFIARKADMLFKEKESDTEKEIQKLSNEDTYAIMPPMEFFMGISYLNLRKHFFNSVQKNDVLIGVVNDVMEGGLLINLLCTDNQKVRDLDGLNIAVFCPAKELPQIHQHFNPTENFQVKDVIRGVVVVVNPENEKIIISLHTRHLEGKSDIFLGLITEEEFPVHYRRRLQVKGLSFDELLKSILGFNNSGNAQFLQKHHSLDDQESLMRGLHGLKIPEPEYAENVRKLQSARKAHQSVLQGVTLFKKGNYLEAMQYLNRALQIDDKNVEGLVARGALYANNECYSRAIEDFDEALKDNPQHTNAMMYLIETLLAQGKVQSDKKDWDSAEETYERVLKLRPNHPEAVDALKVVYIKKEPPPIIKASPKSGAKKPSNDLFDHFIDLIEERKPRQMTPSSSSSRRRRSRSQSPTSRRSSYNRKRSKSPQSRYGHSRGRRRSRSSDRRKSRHDSKSPKKERDNSESPSKMTKEKVKSPRAKSSDKKKSKRKSQSPKSHAQDQHKSKDNDESTRVKGSDTRQSRKHRDLTDTKVSDNQPNSTSPSTKLVKLKSEPNVNKEIITEQKGKEHYTPERSPVLTAREQTPELRSPERKKTRVMSPDKQPNSSSPDWGEKSKTPSQLLRPGSHGRSSSFDEDEYLYGDSSIGYEKDLPTFKNDKEDKYIKTKRLSSPQERRSHDLDDRVEIRKTEKNRKCKDDWKDDVINKDCDGNRRKSFYKDKEKRRSYSHSPENSSRRHRRSSSSDSNTDAKEPYLAKKKKRFNRWDKSPECESKSQDRSSVTKPHPKDQMRGSHFSDAAEKEINQPVPQDYRIQDDASVFHPNMSAEKKGSFTGTITRTIFRSTFQPVVVEAQTEPPKTKPGFFLPRQIVISKKVDERTPNPDLEAGLNDERQSDSNDSHSRSRSPSYSRTDDRHTGHSDIRKKSDDNRKRRDHSSKRGRQVRSQSRSRTRDQSIEERIRSISPIIQRSRERLNYDKDVYANRSPHHSRSSSRESGQGGSSRSSSRDRTTSRKIKRSFSRDRKVNVAGSSLKDDRRNTSHDTKDRKHDIQGGKDRSSLSPYREGFSRDRSNRRSTSNDSWGSIRDEKHGRGTNQDRIVSSREQVGHRSDSQNGERCRRLNPDQKSDRSISHEREDSKYHRSLNRRESSSPDCRQEDSRSWKSPIHRRKYSKSPKSSRQDSESPKNTRKDSKSPNRQDSRSPNRSWEDIRNSKRGRKDRSPNRSRNSHRSKSRDRVSAVEGEYDQKSRSFRISTSKSSERIRDVICSADRHSRNIRQDSKRGEKGARAMGPRQSIGIGYRTYTSKSPSPVRSSNLSKTRSSRSHSRNRSERKRSCSQSRNRLDKSNKPSSRRRSQSRNRSDRSRKPSSRSRSHSRSRKPSSRSRSHSRNRLYKDRKSPSYSRGRSRNCSDKDTKSFLRSRSRSRNHSDKGRKPSSHSRSRSRNRSDEIRKPSSRSNSPSKNQSDKNRKGWRPSRSRSRSLRGSKRPHSRSRSRSRSDRGSKRSHSRSCSRSQSNRNRIRSRCNSKSKIEKTSKSNDNSKRRFTESSNKIAGKPDLPDVISSHKDKKTPTKEKIQKGIKSEDELDKKIIQKRKRMSSSSSSSSSRSSSSSSSSGRRKTHKKPAALKIPLVKSKWDSSPKSSRWDPPDPKPRPPVNIPTYNQKPNKTLTQLETFLLELKQNKKKQTEQTTPPAKDKK